MQEPLPIQTLDDIGLQQTATWTHLDRFHEEVTEAEDYQNPFASIETTQTLQTIASILIGDQNAGKTTFLHSLADESSPEFISLNSLLPTMSTTFTNTRFCDIHMCKAKKIDPLSLCRDEGVFLDSDIARTTMTLTKSDYQFLLRELSLENLGETNCDLINLSLIELGGDHLDRLTRYTETETAGEETPSPFFFGRDESIIVERTLRMLRSRELETVVYMVNYEVTRDETYGDVARRRLEALLKLVPSLKRLILCINRLPTKDETSRDGDGTLRDGDGTLIDGSAEMEETTMSDYDRTICAIVEEALGRGDEMSELLRIDPRETARIMSIFDNLKVLVSVGDVISPGLVGCKDDSDLFRVTAPTSFRFLCHLLKVKLTETSRGDHSVSMDVDLGKILMLNIEAFNKVRVSTETAPSERQRPTYSIVSYTDMQTLLYGLERTDTETPTLPGTTICSESVRLWKMLHENGIGLLMTKTFKIETKLEQPLDIHHFPQNLALIINDSSDQTLLKISSEDPRSVVDGFRWGLDNLIYSTLQNRVLLQSKETRAFSYALSTPIDVTMRDMKADLMALNFPYPPLLSVSRVPGVDTHTSIHVDHIIEWALDIYTLSRARGQDVDLVYKDGVVARIIVQSKIIQIRLTT